VVQKSRIHLLAAASVATLALSAGAASAQMLPSFAGGTWYAKAFGGASWPQSSNLELTFGGERVGDNPDVSFDTGYVVGGSVGYTFLPNLALELEYAYRSADLDGFTLGGPDIEFSGSSRSNSLMLNAIYTFDAGFGPVQPYVGGGLGISWLRLNANSDTLGVKFERDEVLAYQVMAGATYDVAPNWGLFGELRWFGTEHGRWSSDDNFRAGVDTESIDLIFGATVRF
jgi:opacity protein-like surface antigen